MRQLGGYSMMRWALPVDTEQCCYDIIWDAIDDLKRSPGLPSYMWAGQILAALRDYAETTQVPDRIRQAMMTTIVHRWCQDLNATAQAKMVWKKQERHYEQRTGNPGYDTLEC